MNTSSKYANLPFIASGERDVFETDDLPEVDSGSLQKPIHDASIEIIPSGTTEAFQKFSASDEAESIRNRKDFDESYVQKFNRLKTEIDELKSAVSNVDGQVTTLDVDSLESKLFTLQEIRFHNDPTNSSMIVRDIEAVANGKIGDDKPLVKYEIFCKPDKDQILEFSKINYLDQRLKKIENFLGINDTPKNTVFFNDFLKDQSIMNIVIRLSNKMLQLDHSSLERIDARLHAIIEKLNQISAKKSSLENLSMSEKLGELYDHYVKTMQNRQTLPRTLERLQVLNDVQEQACQFSDSLAKMKTIQSEIQLSIEKNSNNLKSLKELVETKSKDIKQIIADFNERLTKLKN